MKTHIPTLTCCFVLIIEAASSQVFGAAVQDEKLTDAIALVRSVYADERTAFLAENLQLTQQEGDAFWPVYRKYREGREAAGDKLVQLVLDYAKLYPDVPDDRARELLKRYSSLEKQLTAQREAYLKKLSKILPPTKTLRLAQLENRLDLALRLKLAAGIPLAPIEGNISGSSTMVTASVEGIPGGTVVQTHEVVATVVAVNQAARKVTLLSPDGIKETVAVGPDAVNFDQIRVGDRVQFELTEELVVYLAAPEDVTGDGAAAVVSLAPKGAKPGGVIAQTVQLTATVVAIDPLKRTATLRFEDGSSRTLPVRRDVDLGKRKVGEKVVLSTSEKVAVTVAKP